MKIHVNIAYFFYNAQLVLQLVLTFFLSYLMKASITLVLYLKYLYVPTFIFRYRNVTEWRVSWASSVIIFYDFSLNQLFGK